VPILVRPSGAGVLASGNATQAEGAVRFLEFIFIIALVAVAPACRVFRAEEWKRRDQCAETLPVLRSMPERPYRVIKVFEADGEGEMAWQACAVGADALISMGFASELETRGGAAVVGPAAFSKTKASEHLFLRGFAIKYARQ
jgi:hypothetical protein